MIELNVVAKKLDTNIYIKSMAEWMGARETNGYIEYRDEGDDYWTAYPADKNPGATWILTKIQHQNLRINPEKRMCIFQMVKFTGAGGVRLIVCLRQANLSRLKEAKEILKDCEAITPPKCIAYDKNDQFGF